MILKNIQIGSKSDENGGPEGPRTSILGSPGGAGPPFWASLGPLWPHSAPQVDFWNILGFIWGVILSPKSVKFGVDFRCVFGTLFGEVLEWFWGCFG